MTPSLDLLLVLIPALPLAGALLAALLGPRLLRQHSHWPVVAGIGLSFIASLGLLRSIYLEQAAQDAASGARVAFEHITRLWTWIDIPQALAGRNLTIDIVLRADALTLVAQGTQRVFFPATAGTVYRIAIDSPSQDVFQFKPYPVGGADDVASATPITGALPLRVKGNNVFATAAPSDEDWHPTYHPTATVWWVWTSPANGAVRMDVRNSDFGTRLTAYERAPGG